MLPLLACAVSVPNMIPLNVCGPTRREKHPDTAGMVEQIKIFLVKY